MYYYRLKINRVFFKKNKNKFKKGYWEVCWRGERNIWRGMRRGVDPRGTFPVLRYRHQHRNYCFAASVTYRKHVKCGGEWRHAASRPVPCWTPECSPFTPRKLVLCRTALPLRKGECMEQSRVTLRFIIRLSSSLHLYVSCCNCRRIHAWYNSINISNP
jgi:hypothetical protein